MDPVRTETSLKLYPLDGIETVLFDIYGTLFVSGSGDVGTAAAVNSSEALIQALIVSGYDGDIERAGELGPELLRTEISKWHKAAKESGIDIPEVEISRVWKKIIERLQSRYLIKPDDSTERILRLAVEYECRVNPVWPMPGALETIRFLKKRGIRLGIVSNAQFYTPLIIETLLGQSIEELGFEKELCIFSYKKMKAKPSLDLFKCLEGKTDLSKTAYTGNDMLNDIWTANEAGCKTILFAGDRRSLRLRKDDPRCTKLISSAIVDDLRQITEIV